MRRQYVSTRLAIGATCVFAIASSIAQVQAARIAPPVLTDPVVIEIHPDYPTRTVTDFDRVGCEGVVHEITLPPGQDALIRMHPDAGALRYPLWVTGGHDVHIQGLEMRPVVQPGCDVGEAHQVRVSNPNIHPRLPGGKLFRVEQGGTTYVEGVDADLQGMEADCFVMRNPPGMSVEQATTQRHMHFVNTRCVGYEGLDDSPIGDGIHGDFFQNQGRDNMASFVMDGVTYQGSSNGVTLHGWNGDRGKPRQVLIRDVNYADDPRYENDDRYEISGLAFTVHGHNIAFENVWIDERRGLNYGYVNGQRVGASGHPEMRREPNIHQGQPPGGDFAPASRTGLEYSRNDAPSAENSAPPIVSEDVPNIDAEPIGAEPDGIEDDGSDDPEGSIAALPTSTEANHSAACAIWLCLPGGFLPSECSEARREMMSRVLRGKGPAPSWGSCFSGAPMEAHYGYAARMPDGQYVHGRQCVTTDHNDDSSAGSPRTPRGCVGTSRFAAVTDENNRVIGEIAYWPVRRGGRRSGDDNFNDND